MTAANDGEEDCCCRRARKSDSSTWRRARRAGMASRFVEGRLPSNASPQNDAKAAVSLVDELLDAEFDAVSDAFS